MKHEAPGESPREPTGGRSPGTARAGDDSEAGPDTALGRLPRVRAYFGTHYEQIARYAELLANEGVRRGLIGPGEVGRLWARHILNSAAVAPYLPATGAVIDLGSGAGLPGVVLAVMRPDLRVLLVEPMERRAAWLREVVSDLGLTSEVIRARAEELHGELAVEAVTARAVAPLSRLVPWSLPLLAKGGVLLALKGERAAEEVRSAAEAIQRAGGGLAETLVVGTVDEVEPTTLVRVVRERVGPRWGPEGRRR